MQKTLVMLFVLGGFFCLQPAMAQAPYQPLKLEDIRRDIQKHGPKKVVDQLAKGDGKAWLEVEQHIANGDANWIELALELRPGTDAGTGEGLVIALATALPKNPEAVLDLEGGTMSLKNVCSLPFIEPEEAFVKSYSAAALQALDSVKTPSLQVEAEVCRLRLTSVLELWEKRRMAR